MIESESGDLQTCVHVAVLPNNVVLSQLCDAQSESQGEQDENESGDLDQHGHLLSDLLNTYNQFLDGHFDHRDLRQLGKINFLGCFLFQ